MDIVGIGFMIVGLIIGIRALYREYKEWKAIVFDTDYIDYVE